MMQVTPDSRPTAIALGLLFSLIGLVSLAFCGYEVKSRMDFLRVAQVAAGRVEHLNAGGSHPQVGFTTADGQQVSYPQNGLIFGYEKGEAVRVLYLPERAQATAVVDSTGALWGMTLLGALLGVFFIMGGVQTFKGNRR